MDTTATTQHVQPVIRAMQYLCTSDFTYMIDHPPYDTTLLVFNDNVMDMLTSCDAGRGNACIRPHAWPRKRKRYARSFGIPTGWSKACGGFQELTDEVKEIIDLSVERLHSQMRVMEAKEVIYSSDTDNMIECGKNNVAESVRKYITEQINNIPHLTEPRDMPCIRHDEWKYYKVAEAFTRLKKTEKMVKDAKKHVETVLEVMSLAKGSLEQ